MTTAEANLLAAQLIVEALRRRGTDCFVVCPGSRSSPLALAVSHDKRMRIIVHHDERGAAYYAVGYARATGRAAAVITTSGTAAVNLFPGIVEASMDNLPLIALTADRPPELRGAGANQTIDQVRLFGNYVRHFADLPCPDDTPDMADTPAVVDETCRCALGMSSRPGPVHLNCMFREPLVPPPDSVRTLSEGIAARLPALTTWLESGNGLRAESVVMPDPDTATMDTIVQSVGKSRRGILIVGSLRSEREQEAVLQLGRKLNWPTFADITSGLSGSNDPHVVKHHDLVLASERFAQQQAPDMILHVGGRFTSRRLLQFLDHRRPATYWFNAGAGIIFDPLRVVTSRTDYDTSLFCRMLTDSIESQPTDSSWLKDWMSAGMRVSRAISDHQADDTSLTEPSIALALSRRLPRSAALFLASSMPIRDMDTFADFAQNTLVASNRGASGIDGTIASACGYAAGLDRPVTLLVGDQAFLHDLNSLALVRKSQTPITIVLVNNNGGRIFEQLPISEHRSELQSLFVAPHGLSFGRIAATFEIDYVQVVGLRALKQVYDDTAGSGRTTIIEAKVDPAASQEHRAGIVRAAVAAVDQG